MAQTELVGIMAAAAGRRAAERLDPPPVAVVRGELAAILAPAGPRTARASRRAVAEAMLARQRWLERLMAFGPLLPAATATPLDAVEAPGFLVANSARLGEALRAVGGLRQYQVTVAWDPAAALRRFAGEREFAGLPAGPFGRAHAAAAERLRQRLGQDFAAALARASADRLALPLDGAETLVNAAILADPDRLDELDRALEAIDAVWPEGLRVRLVGPLPPVSFAAVAVERPAPADLAAARGLLGVTAEGARALGRAFRARVAAAHPDRGAGDAADLGALAAARDRIAAVDRARQSLAAAGLAEAPVLLARIRRDGDAAAPPGGGAAALAEAG